MNTMSYQGYNALITFDEEAGLFHGEVINLRDVITFQGQSITELRQALAESVDDYLAFCKERGEAPDKPYSGKVMLRFSPSLHARAAIAARLEGKSLNQWAEEALTAKLEKTG